MQMHVLSFQRHPRRLQQQCCNHLMPAHLYQPIVELPASDACPSAFVSDLLHLITLFTGLPRTACEMYCRLHSRVSQPLTCIQTQGSVTEDLHTFNLVALHGVLPQLLLCLLNVSLNILLRKDLKCSAFCHQFQRNIFAGDAINM
jgi:hypothetical protein